MYSNVCSTCQNSGLHFFDKDTLPPNGVQRHILSLITGGINEYKFNVQPTMMST
jgi:hypothetical protein